MENHVYWKIQTALPPFPPAPIDNKKTTGTTPSTPPPPLCKNHSDLLLIPSCYKRPMGLDIHLSIRDSSLTCQMASYLSINMSIIIE